MEAEALESISRPEQTLVGWYKLCFLKRAVGFQERRRHREQNAAIKVRGKD